jgi:hypothetical protein
VQSLTNVEKSGLFKELKLAESQGWGKIGETKKSLKTSKKFKFQITVKFSLN